jgi:hypothetical protein
VKALLVFGITLVTGLAVAEHGHSCTRPASLGPTEPRAAVAEADAAFIGTLVGVKPKDPPGLSSGAPYILTFAVEERIKGDLGDRVEVTSTVDGASCGGHDGTIGRRGAYLLSRREDEWGPWGIAEVSPDALRTGMLPLPRPDGLGRPTFVAGGHFGLVRSATLDSRGRTLAYGLGRGAVTALSICPGRKVVAELIRAGESVRFALRRLPSLRLLRETDLRTVGFGEKVVCRSRTGSDVLAAVQTARRERAETRILQITPVGTRIVEKAPQLAMAVHAQQVFISLSDGRLVVRDLATGARRTVLRAPPLTGMSISPDRRFVAGFTPETLVVADLLSGTTKAKRWRGAVSQTRWVGRRTFAAWSRGSGDLELLDQNLRRLHPAWAWPAHTTTVSAARVFGVDWSGGFLTERNGYIVRLGKLFSPAVSVLEPI